MVRSWIDLALAEDTAGEAEGDVTTQACVDETSTAEAVMVAKAHGVLAGLAIANMVFRKLDSGMRFTRLVEDGGVLAPGTEVARFRGQTRALLTGERVALNFVQRLSGVASLTARFVERVRGTGANILDTRKTTPGWRRMERYAVRRGGGVNHRFGLFDMILIKDNHIRAAGSLSEAVRRARKARTGLDIEVEAQSLVQVKEAMDARVDRVLLDNFELAELARAVAIVRAAEIRPRIEVSGGVNLDTVRAIAELGVDDISVGALTHSAPALDLSLEVVELD